MKYKGLSSVQAKKALQEFGYNEIKVQKTNAWKILLNQIASPLVYLLIAAAIISFITNDFTSALVITFILCVNTFLGFVQEYRSGKIFEKLENFISTNATVYRDDQKIIIDRKFLVPGDIVLLKLGDIVPVDCYLLEQNDLVIDESTLTGESNNIYKEVLDLNSLQSYTKVDDKYILYSGSSIAKGSATAKVFATGLKSKFGKISDLSINTKKVSEYEQNLVKISKWFTILSIISLVFILTAHLVFDKDINIITLLLFTMAIAITIIPEALPVISTLTLTKGATKLSKLGVIIRKISSIQDLGNIDIICTDKTGTLTKNKLDIVKFSTADKEKFFKYSCLISHSSTDPFDVSIYEYAKSQCNEEIFPDEYKDIPFDPQVRYSSREYSDFTIFKGSPENILEKTCTKDQEKKILSEINQMGSQGYRDISLALKTKDRYEYLGTYFFQDEIKEDAAETIKFGRREHIEFKIVTGDSIEVAFDVGKKVGLISGDHQIIEASNLSFDDDEKLFKEVQQYHIFARCAPEQKYNIIKALQKQFHVGYLGDGVNDAPSLKISNVGMVVDTASDIAKSNSDIILLTKDLSVIVKGVMEGRKVFVNIDKYLKHTLSSNFGNLYTIGLISLFLHFLPMLPIQILVNNLLTDIPCLAFSTDNVEQHDIKKPKHHSIKNIIIFSTVLGLISSLFDILFFITFQNSAESDIQGYLFLFSTLSELFIIFSMRTSKFIFNSTKPSKLLWLMTISSAGIACVLAVFGFTFLSLSPIDFKNFLLIIALTIGYLIVSEICKLLLYKYFRQNHISQ